nr:hypothetical protein [Butyrivibrio sp.]
MGNHAGRRLTILFTIIILMITGCQSGFAIGKDAVGTFTQIHVKGDISFDYQLYVPDGSDKMPLVILFHGYG